eukprot:12134536-Alexandrium_andersonii.AAC.1
MSASLVGSEMCIRDRAEHPAWAEWGCPCTPTTRRPGRLEAAPMCRSTGAVSYTHLTLPTICSV